ncbi:hypothetical protein MXB_49 [Myxobolus squamalis]|nr:hypothetical protein MXB_49 [Myxobolus squamalis]
MQNEYHLIKSHSKLAVPNTNPRKIAHSTEVQHENGDSTRHATHEDQKIIPAGYRTAAASTQRLPVNLNYQLSGRESNERIAKTDYSIRNASKHESPSFNNQPIYSLRPHPIKSSTPSRPLLTLTAQAPSLIRIGQNKSSTTNFQNYTTVSQPFVHTQKSQQPIQTFAEDDNIYARRLRGALNNHQKRVINPKISPFTSENDVVSQLLPYHLYQDDTNLNEEELNFGI